MTGRLRLFAGSTDPPPRQLRVRWSKINPPRTRAPDWST